jgi:shikimate dehydrogenase
LAGPELLGINLTLPLKQVAFQFARRVTLEAEQVGAINCLRWTGQDWEGHNSDAQGWLDSYQEQIGLPLAGRKTLVIGAGGACRAILAALRQQQAGPLVLFNRTPERSRALLRAGDRSSPLENFASELEADCLVIQTTSVGMWPEVDRSPVEWPSQIPSGVLACDLIYNPSPSLWLSQAAERGALTLDGCGMLVHQAARAIEWWSGLRPDPAPMLRALRQSL